MKTGTCRDCGERIGHTTTATEPVEPRWLHEGWQSDYDHLPKPFDLADALRDAVRQRAERPAHSKRAMPTLRGARGQVCADCGSRVDTAHHHAECVAPLYRLDGGAA